MEAFRWTQSGGMVGLGGLLEDAYSVAYAVSGDGSVIVGHSTSDEYYGEAFIWDAEHGMRPLADVLADYGFDVAGWQLREAYGISADGLTICGWGINPGAQHEAWVVHIPEPTAVVLLSASLLLLRRRCAD
jgi:probable HAF family extracellular repeat protein